MSRSPCPLWAMPPIIIEEHRPISHYRPEKGLARTPCAPPLSIERTGCCFPPRPWAPRSPRFSCRTPSTVRPPWGPACCKGAFLGWTFSWFSSRSTYCDILAWEAELGRVLGYTTPLSLYYAEGEARCTQDEALHSADQRVPLLPELTEYNTDPVPATLSLCPAN